jgi:uncharacterized protein (DUF58 family)
MRSLTAGFTTRAGCLLAAGITALGCGLVLGELDLVRAGCLAAALPLVAAVVMRRSHVAISSRRSGGPYRAQAGERVSVKLSVTNRSLLPTGALMFEDKLPARLTGRARFVVSGLGSRESRTIGYRLPGLDRGRYTVGPLRLRLTDPFGLIDITRSFVATSTFVVTPVVDALPGLVLPRSWDAGDNASSNSVGIRGADDASTREYRQGDDLRKIHWRSTARTGALMVRHEERPWQGHTTLLLDTRATAHETGSSEPGNSDARLVSSFEWAVSCIASVAEHLLRAGRETTLVTGATTIRPSGPARASLLDQLAGLTPSGEADLSTSLEPLRTAGRDSAVIAVLGRMDTESIRVLTRIRPRGSRATAFAVLLDTPSWQSPEATDPSWRHSADMLRAAGWWVVAARSGDTAAQVWTSLLGRLTGRELSNALHEPGGQ